MTELSIDCGGGSTMTVGTFKMKIFKFETCK